MTTTSDTPKFVSDDAYLAPYADVIKARLQRFQSLTADIEKHAASLGAFASGHEFFGLHRSGTEWVFREWAPNADRITIVGDFCSWDATAGITLERCISGGIWEGRIPRDRLRHGHLYRLHMEWPGGHGDRLPAYARRVVQDPESKIFNAQVWDPPSPYHWKESDFQVDHAHPIIYEAHIGMAQSDGKVGTYDEFTENILPRVVAAGYNTLQLMAIQEHPYYGSFGYQVSNFFAASSRYGTPDQLKRLVDTAHGHGLAVIMDLVHSHAVRNDVEGLSRFDGTEYQYFHAGSRGYHPAWDSRCFDYGRREVLHFLLSNCRYWLDEYRVDGYRFDGVTSMLYHHHGLNTAFTSYEQYFGADVDEDAICYLTLANSLIHMLRSDAITVAEDMSGMPGMAVTNEHGGLGFDYRLGMGLPDFWIKLVKDRRDEDWHVAEIWHEVTNHRQNEMVISYAESHDQALVGDQTLSFRLMGAAMYDQMRIDNKSIVIDRGVALHKMIRLISLACGDGYLNFMGNEFGHPDWIDFPRAGNNWSYHYARRQWGLRDDPGLRYYRLAAFDCAMIHLARSHRLLSTPRARLSVEHDDDKMIAFERGDLLFIFNFHPDRSYSDYAIPVSAAQYRLVLDSDDTAFSGHGRVQPGQTYAAIPGGSSVNAIRVYIPTRTALVVRADTAATRAGPRLGSPG